ncbi:MAG: AAA family ATPase [Planctomycetes bacterium]|nr:AAA family ATPase [Planctomycetota bacterium]
MADADVLSKLSSLMQRGLFENAEEQVASALKEIFGGRYYQAHLKDAQIRSAAYRLGALEDDRGVPYAGLISPDNPPSGAYGGTSIVWFPTKEKGSLLGLGVGTRGIAPDEGLLTRPGHRRRVEGLRRLLSQQGVSCWTKSDPAALGAEVPESVVARFSSYKGALERYKHEVYCNVAITPDMKPEQARQIVQQFFDLYAYERGWKPLAIAAEEFDKHIEHLERQLFEHPNCDSINNLLQSRRFVVLQGPPGTGKTRLAEQVRERHFSGRGTTIQFHPSVTYEDFVIGLSPEPAAQGLAFRVKPGWLLQAYKEAVKGPYLLIIDEVNRADLGRVLGEAVYLFEADEVGGENPRTVRLAHEFDGKREFALSPNLYVLATMNTADRSIAHMDLAIRRRFAFANLPPDPAPIRAARIGLASDAFERLSRVFVEFCNDDALSLLPGHAYFLARDEADLLQRFKFALLPLLDDYLRQGLVGGAQGELQAVRDWLYDTVEQGS